MQIFWNTYKNLEREIEELMQVIHIDDNQLKVYSGKIGDLIIRAATDIESIVKFLYKQEVGRELGKKPYDYVGIKELNDIWSLDKKEIEISSIYCDLSKATLFPFKKTTKRTGTKIKTYKWNNAYQNLKHDKISSLKKFGKVRYLFDVMSALFLLNLYLKSEQIELGEDLSSFNNSLGSKIFSIKTITINGFSGDGSINLNGNKFTEKGKHKASTYLLIPSQEQRSAFNEINKKFSKLQSEMMMEHLQRHLHLIESGEKTPEDILTKTVKNNIFKSAARKMDFGKHKSTYTAVINKGKEKFTLNDFKKKK